MRGFYNIKIFALLSFVMFFYGDVAKAKDKRTFELYKVNEFIQEFAINELDSENIKLLNSDVQRKGSKRAFSIDEVKKLRISDKYFISEFSIDDKNKSIQALLKEDDGDNFINYNSRYELGVRMPVVNKRIRSGDIITQEDIKFEYFSARKIKRNAINDIIEIIGKEAKGNIQKGDFVTKSSIHLKDLDLIKKNKTITVVFNSKNLQLKSKAIAMEDGELGETISIKNVESGKIFDAVVTDKDYAVISNTKNKNNIASLETNNKNNL